MSEIEFVNILEVENSLKDKVRQWRNKPEIRRFMLTQKIINQKEHCQWLESLKGRNDRKFWVVFFKGIPMGAVYLEIIDYQELTSQWGFYIGEDTYRGKGLSKTILFRLLQLFFDEMGFNKLFTKVLSGNTVALNLYKKFRFREMGKAVFNGNEKLILLEFSKKDWIQFKNVLSDQIISLQNEKKCLLREEAMNFGKISRIILFGSSPLIIELIKKLESKPCEIFVFSSSRHLKEPLSSDGKTLKDLLQAEKIEYFCAKDINADVNVRKLITKESLGIGLGECWSFSKELIDLFGGKLLDLMTIRLPQYRGGAHYSWQILRRNRVGNCNLQIINEEMVPAKFDSGAIVKSKEFLHPSWARIPRDYFKSLLEESLSFLLEFIDEIEQGKDFVLLSLQENFSIFFPRLYTQKHGYIDWSWKTQDIESFICAFDDPYPGSSTFLDGKRVFLKKCTVEYFDGHFHPFQSGLVYRKSKDACCIASCDGTLIIKEIINEKGENIINEMELGQRFYTPAKYIEEAMLYNAEYDSMGLKK